MLLSTLLKLAIGATLGGVIGAIITGDYLYTIVAAVGVPAVIMIALFAGLRGKRAPGRSGFSIARVETVQRVGSNVDGSQLVDVRLTVVGDITYTTTSRGTFTDDHLRTIKPGSIVAVQLAGTNRPDARIITTPTDAVEAELATARLDPSAIAVASSVPAWETATTTTPGTPKPGSRPATSAGAVGKRVLSFALVVVAAAAVLIPAYQSIGRGINNIATGNWDGSDMVTGLYLQESVDQMIEAAGTNQFSDLGFYPTYILGDAVSRTSDEHTDSVTWRYGRAWVDGPSFIQDDDLADSLFDASVLDISMVSRVARESVELSGIDTPETVYASVRMNPELGEPQIGIFISGRYDDAYLDYDFEGRLLSQGGSVFDE
ncbi:MAG: hypothetical protein M3Y46_10265 [Actinomycetota bacterium]|nr:hypothetical protein [Actinomycetota bacterium]